MAATPARGARGDDGSGARWSLFLSFDGGIEVLVDALARQLPEGAVRLGQPVAAAVERSGIGAGGVDGFDVRCA